MRSEFFTITSTSITDFQPIDLSGAREVVMVLNKDLAGTSGFISNDPFVSDARFPITATQDMPPLVVHSTDNRLYFVAGTNNETVLYVWVIRQ